MIDMDYEKKYNEALKRARANYKADKEMGFLENCDMLELIFPELKESEDERIRKAIIHYILYETKGTISEATEHVWVTWLEKQKECVADTSKTSASEDERIRKFLLDYAVEMIAGLESDISLSVYDGIKGHDPDAEEELAQWQKARGWLKYLGSCPKSSDNWKPSEEQMRCLEMVLSSEAMDDNVHDVLAKLYEQLKKLM